MTTSNVRSVEFVSNSVDQTLAFGRQLGQGLSGGQIIAVIGPLGSGKTCLIKGICMGCGCQDLQDVTSPTFVLINEYHGRLDIYHIDAYRLEGPKQLAMLGFDELVGPRSVLLIEWADKVMAALEGYRFMNICLSHLGPQSRRIVIENPTGRIRKALGSIEGLRDLS